MPKLRGLFDSFDNIDAVSKEAIVQWLKPAPQFIWVENYLANRILYPQTLPQTKNDMQVDLAILREALKMSQTATDAASGNVPQGLFSSSPFLNIPLKKLLIPFDFFQFVPDLPTLAGVFIDAFLISRRKTDKFDDLWTIVLRDDTDEIAGSILLPQFDNKEGSINLELLGRHYEVRQGNLTILPCPKDRCEISYKMRNGKILGKVEDAIEIYGGKLGLVIDGRSE